MASWKESFSAYLQPRLFIVLFLGFSSGLPFGMLIDPLNFWLSEEEISRSSIGLLSLTNRFRQYRNLQSIDERRPDHLHGISECN